MLRCYCVCFVFVVSVITIVAIVSKIVVYIPVVSKLNYICIFINYKLIMYIMNISMFFINTHTTHFKFKNFLIYILLLIAQKKRYFTEVKTNLSK